MTDKEKIRAEIERRMKGKCPIVCSYIIYEDILNFIDSIQEEPRFKTGDRIKPVDSCLGSPRTIVDVCDSWYVTDQGTLDFEYEDNWELTEEHKKCMYSKGNYTNEDRKALCDGCKEECKYNKKEPSIPDIVDEHFDEMLDEEHANEDLEKALLRLCPLPPCYNEEQRKSKDYADSWWRARDEQNGFRLGAFWQKKNIIYIACEWLRNHLADYWDRENNYLNISGCIYEFREAMKSAKKGEPVEKDKLRALSDGKQHLGWLDDAEALENHVSEGLEEAAHQYYKPNETFMDGFKKGAKWQKENLWKHADGDDLPEIDREVIALLDSGKVVFAHRPPEFWDGKNIITGKVTRNYPKTYDKGGWNQPNVKWWLGVDKLPNVED